MRTASFITARNAHASTDAAVRSGSLACFLAAIGYINTLKQRILRSRDGKIPALLSANLFLISEKNKNKYTTLTGCVFLTLRYRRGGDSASAPHEVRQDSPYYAMPIMVLALRCERLADTALIWDIDRFLYFPALFRIFSCWPLIFVYLSRPL